MKQRWFRLLIGLFPASLRDERGGEMSDAIEDVAPTGRAAIRESVALMVAAGGAWNRDLRSPSGLIRSAVFGAAAWAGMLVAIGPAVRVMAALQNGGEVGAEVGPTLVLGIGLIIGSILVVRRSGVAAISLTAVGVVAVAAANTGAQWSFPEAVWYEARWLGMPLLFAALLVARLDPRERGIAVTPAIVTVALIGCVSLVQWQIYQSMAARNYAIVLRWDVLEPLGVFRGTGVWMWVWPIVVLITAVGLFSHPGLAALAAPAGLHLAVVSPTSALLPALVVAAAVLWRPIARRVDIDVRWRRPDRAGRMEPPSK